MFSYDVILSFSLVFFFKQKTAYEMRISDWSSDVCSSDLFCDARHRSCRNASLYLATRPSDCCRRRHCGDVLGATGCRTDRAPLGANAPLSNPARRRSEEHTSELQSLMRISYAVFCLKKKKNTKLD